LIFTGHSDHTVDAKLRLAIPAKYRNQMSPEADGEAWYCVPAESSLRLYTERTFESLAAAMESSLVPDSDRAELDAIFFGLAERLEMDAQGRIPLPKRHLELAGLGGGGGEVVVVGARNRLEVRDRGAWLAGQQERFARLPALVARIEARRGSRES
jgi:MraZ protein